MQCSVVRCSAVRLNFVVRNFVVSEIYCGIGGIGGVGVTRVDEMNDRSYGESGEGRGGHVWLFGTIDSRSKKKTKNNNRGRITALFTVFAKSSSRNEDAGSHLSQKRNVKDKSDVPPCPHLPPMLRPIVCEKVTKGGARHLCIDISAYENGNGIENHGVQELHRRAPSSITFPVTSEDIHQHIAELEASRDIFTTEMFSLLASPVAGRAILGDINIDMHDLSTSEALLETTELDPWSAGATMSPRCSRPVPVALTRVDVLVGKSPLGVTREDRVRRRKIHDRGKGRERERDVQRKKAMMALDGVGRCGLERGFGAVGEGGSRFGEEEEEEDLIDRIEVITDCEDIEDEDVDVDVDEVEGEGVGDDMVWVQREEWERLKRLNRELAGELSRSVGLESWCGARLDAEEVLDMYRKVRRNVLLRR
ncbi:hypothetical protein P280DRAFT_508397 [Massarina eburnea CBS 473.64]|uniref:Uncharacterized protein n=1 Tax=Massarina eburnea CBS 473.64 TaxID=1395130 RepID=A0A6A6RVV0_9PLEO|nr:hypothetical protein P280DRAFT_508397 [Massarina eburnea CBS 473.64]